MLDISREEREYTEGVRKQHRHTHVCGKQQFLQDGRKLTRRKRYFFFATTVTVKAQNTEIQSQIIIIWLVVLLPD